MVVEVLPSNRGVGGETIILDKEYVVRKYVQEGHSKHVFNMMQVAKNQGIPVEEILYHDNSCRISKYVEGVTLDSLPQSQQQIYYSELTEIFLRIKKVKSSDSPEIYINEKVKELKEKLQDFPNVIQEDFLRPDASTCEVVFSHLDLHSRNIIVDPKSNRVAAVIDWDFSGFYPDFVEYTGLKMSNMLRLPIPPIKNDLFAFQRCIIFVKHKDKLTLPNITFIKDIINGSG